MARCSSNPSNQLAACHCCGQIHRVPGLTKSESACCVRCGSVVRYGVHPRSISRTAAISATALVLYPVAIMLPIMEIERFGHLSDASIWSGMIGLFAEGHLFVGFAVLLFSVLAPLGKLGLLFVLCAGQGVIAQQDRARAYRLVEMIGRWGMVDVLLVAILVSIVKLGDLVEVAPGPGVWVFGIVVILSLLASGVFDPHAIWEERNATASGPSVQQSDERKDRSHE